MRFKHADAAVFVASLIFLSVFYGWMARALEWFPHGPFQATAVQIADWLSPRVPHFAGEPVHGWVGARLYRPDEVQSGLTLITTHATTGIPTALLVDVDGLAVHTWPIDVQSAFPDRSILNARIDAPTIHGSYVYPDGDIVLNLSYLGLLRVDACGDVVWAIRNSAHHSVTRADDGTFWVPTSTSELVPASDRYPSGYPGLARPVHHDRLTRVSEDGEVLNNLSVLDILYDNGLERYLAKARVPDEHDPGDILHVNDVEPLPDSLASQYPLFGVGDLVVSVRASDLVMVVDPDDGLVKWHTTEPLVWQHDPDFIGGGWIGVFNNNWDWTEKGELMGGSEILAFQPHTDSIQLHFRGSRSTPFQTPYLGKWQRLENGNLLLTEGRPGRVLEVNPEGELVWEWVPEPFEGKWAVEITEGSRYPLSVGDVQAWQCGDAAGDR